MSVLSYHIAFLQLFVLAASFVEWILDSLLFAVFVNSKHSRSWKASDRSTSMNE